MTGAGVDEGEEYGGAGAAEERFGGGAVERDLRLVEGDAVGESLAPDVVGFVVNDDGALGGVDEEVDAAADHLAVEG